VLAYHRVGSAGSSRIDGALGIEQHASHCRALLRYLGVERARFVGHSSGGNVALQLALDAPALVHSLAILEPALMTVPSAARFTRDDARRIVQPVLAVAGGGSLAYDRIWAERHDLLLSWLPHAEPFVVPGATHLLQVQTPHVTFHGGRLCRRPLLWPSGYVRCS
jgi:pimeloyl-ACP methyl ester carboxylesterase